MAIQSKPVVITSSPGMSVSHIRTRAAWRKRLVLFIVALLSVLIADSLALKAESPFLVAGFTGAAVLVPLLWLRPAIGVYILITGAALFESFSLNYPDSLTDKVPFFKSFSSLGSPVYIPLTLAETLMLMALGIVAVKRMMDRQPPLELGPLSWGIGMYGIALLFGFLHGILTGGDFNIALWEVRAPLYLVLVYTLAFTVIKEKAQVQKVLWLLLIAIAIKGVLGAWRFAITLGGDLGKVPEVSTFNSLLAHEESLFLALFLAISLVLFLFRSHPGQMKFIAVFSLPVLVAFLANERRAGILALLIMVGVITLFGYLLVPARRKPLGVIVTAGLFLFPLYTLVFGGSSGIVALPARAVMSVFVPDPRDLSSNNYRVIESQDLKLNVAENPILGKGYGKPIRWYIPIPDLSNLLPFWAYIPHNTVLWVWLRLGFIGFTIFWFLVGRMVIQGAITARQTQDPYLRGIAVLSVAAVLAWVSMGALDMGLADFRSTIVIGALVAMMARMSSQAKQEDSTALREAGHKRATVIEPFR